MVIGWVAQSIVKLSTLFELQAIDCTLSCQCFCAKPRLLVFVHQSTTMFLKINLYQIPKPLHGLGIKINWCETSIDFGVCLHQSTTNSYQSIDVQNSKKNYGFLKQLIVVSLAVDYYWQHHNPIHGFALNPKSSTLKPRTKSWFGSSNQLLCP